MENKSLKQAQKQALRKTDVAGSAVGRREILEKHWHQFRIASGLSYEPMSEKAYEYFELAMQEYTEIFIQNHPKQISAEVGNRKDVLKEVYKKWNEFDNDFLFIDWLSDEVR